MEIKMKENINLKSAVLRHQIALEAVELLYGREESLQTEIEIYTILAFVDTLSANNLIEECNQDKRNLIDIMEHDVEPVFLQLVEDENYYNLYKEILNDVMLYCHKVYEENHSLIGMLNTITEAISSLEPEQVKDVLAKTGEIAGRVKEKELAQQKMIADQKAKQTEEVNDKLQQLINKFTKIEEIPEATE